MVISRWPVWIGALFTTGFDMGFVEYESSSIRANIIALGETVGRHENNGFNAYSRPRLIASHQGIEYGESDELHREFSPCPINQPDELILRAGGFVDRAPLGKLVLHVLGVVVGFGGDLYDTDVDVDDPQLIDLDVELQVSQLQDGDTGWSAASVQRVVTDSISAPFFTFRRNSPYRLLQLLKASDGASVPFEALEQHGRFDQLTKRDLDLLRLFTFEIDCAQMMDDRPLRVDLVKTTAVDSSVAIGAFYAVTSSLYWIG